MKCTILLILTFLMFGCEALNEESDSTGGNEKSGLKKIEVKRWNQAELASIIPDKIDNYVPRNEPEGLDVEFQNGSFSFTTQYYYHDNDSINIELFDYLDCPEEYQRYSNLWWGSGVQVDNEQLSSQYKSYEEGVDAWEVFDKIEKRTTVYLGVDKRFYLIFECFGKESTAFISKIAKEFDYDKLYSNE